MVYPSVAALLVEKRIQAQNSALHLDERKNLGYPDALEGNRVSTDAVHVGRASLNKGSIYQACFVGKVADNEWMIQADSTRYGRDSMGHRVSHQGHRNVHEHV